MASFKSIATVVTPDSDRNSDDESYRADPHIKTVGFSGTGVGKPRYEDAAPTVKLNIKPGMGSTTAYNEKVTGKVDENDNHELEGEEGDRYTNSLKFDICERQSNCDPEKNSEVIAKDNITNEAVAQNVVEYLKGNSDNLVIGWRAKVGKWQLIGFDINKLHEVTAKQLNAGLDSFDLSSLLDTVSQERDKIKLIVSRDVINVIYSMYKRAKYSQVSTDWKNRIKLFEYNDKDKSLRLYKYVQFIIQADAIDTASYYGGKGRKTHKKKLIRKKKTRARTRRRLSRIKR